MRPSHAIELSAATSAALRLLADYESTLARVVQQPADESLYTRSADQFETMRGLTSELARIRVCWVEVLISRYELLEGLWRVKSGDVACAQLDRLQSNHFRSLQTFKRLCLQQVESQAPSVP